MKVSQYYTKKLSEIRWGRSILILPFIIYQWYECIFLPWHFNSLFWNKYSIFSIFVWCAQYFPHPVHETWCESNVDLRYLNLCTLNNMIRSMECFISLCPHRETISFYFHSYLDDFWYIKIFLYVTQSIIIQN